MNAEELADRLLNFNGDIVKTCSPLQKTYIGRHIFGQLFRASSSSGANYEEARGAESRADFVHKMQIVLKELRESAFWLRLIQRVNLLPDNAICPLINEANELIRIFSKSVVTSKSPKKFEI
ncbi:MAG: four helix bundle protein [Candidatus Marinimicrobia bacterium CG08_land_8_20_14_0_20_45_22]|nr:MAG: four helix bundle protein [Candidatus Marinimicrobia bacterium CG08_land_8_20_14_0_20_45_22]